MKLFNIRRRPSKWMIVGCTLAMAMTMGCSSDAPPVAESKPETQERGETEAQLFRRRWRRRSQDTVSELPQTSMPGKSYEGALPELNEAQQTTAKRLQADVTKLAKDIGERNVYEYRAYMKAANYIEEQLKDAGYKVSRQTVHARGRDCFNLEASIPGAKREEEIIVVGAHYDSVPDCPAANDNGSGVAATLELARLFADKKFDRTLRFVLFANEEQPFFHSESMGSLVYARRCKAREEKIVGMLSLETMGYFSDKEGSQNYPAPLNLIYPSVGNFIGFVGNTDSAKLVKQTVGTFRKHAKFPSEGAALPGIIDGVGWSDHWSFWQVGYPAVMVTDTAPFRYPHYHLKSDTPDKLNYERMALVVSGLEQVVADLASTKSAE